MPKGSDVFRNVIESARKQLVLDHEKSSAFAHPSIKGNERAASFADFLRQRLPDYLEVTVRGEAIDCYDHRTGELDILIYDKLAARPISQQRESALVPCEALYVVVEVKSVLNKSHVEACLQHSQFVRNLKPFGHKFVDARRRGAAAQSDSHRCLYIVVAYTSDIAAKDWMKKEYGRLVAVAEELNLSATVIDKIFVVDRGIINPVRAQGKIVEKGPEYLLAELFIHLVEFVERESSRRPPIKWDIYALPDRKGWASIR